MPPLAKLSKYLKGIAHGLFVGSPRKWRKLLGRSPYSIQRCDALGFSILVSIDDSAISKPILCTGEYERNVTNALIDLLKQQTHFLDVGANIGFFTLLAAARCDQGKVISFEPDPSNARMLKASIALNGFDDRVSFFPHAVSDQDEQLSFSNLDNPENLGARFTAKNAKTLEEHAPSGHPDIIQVEAVRLDRVLAHEHVDVIKIDIEGFEPLAFQGMTELIDRCHPTIISEFAPGTIQHISETDPRDLLSFFKQHGYSLGIIEDNGALTSLAQDADAVMARFSDPLKHHVDLLLRYKG